MSRKSALSKTELQKARALWLLTGENRAERRKRVRAAMGKPAASTVAELGDSKDAPAPQSKLDVLKDKVAAEFAEKPRKKKA